MSRSVLLASLAGALSVATVAAAQVKATPESDGPSATRTSEDKVAENDPDRRICKTVVATGSRLGKSRICRTARQWADQKEEDKKALDKLQKVQVQGAD